MGDGSGLLLQRKGDALANQDTCVSALRGKRVSQRPLSALGFCYYDKCPVDEHGYDEDCAIAALRQIILTNGTLLKEDIHKVCRTYLVSVSLVLYLKPPPFLLQRLQDLVLPLCVRLQQQQCGSDVGGASGQYGSAPPRRELYRLLLALVLAPSPRWPPPLSCAVSIFSHGRRDHSLSVSDRGTDSYPVLNAVITEQLMPWLCIDHFLWQTIELFFL